MTADEANPHYALYRSVAEFVLRPIRTNVAAIRTHEEKTLRSPSDLLEAAVTHAPLGKCLFYVARFTRAGQVNVKYAVRQHIGAPVRPYAHKSFLPFYKIRALIGNDRIASLYEDYPTMGNDLESANVQMTYRRGEYTISGPQRQFWPDNLRAFISSVDHLVVHWLPLCRGTPSGI